MTALTGEVDAIGGRFNAATAKEYTFYYVKCASEYAPQALDVLADMLRNSLFDPTEVEREKGVIIEEIRAKFDVPSDYVDENFELLIYGDTPLGRLRIGTRGDRHGDHPRNAGRLRRTHVRAVAARRRPRRTHRRRPAGRR